MEVTLNLRSEILVGVIQAKWHKRKRKEEKRGPISKANVLIGGLDPGRSTDNRRSEIRAVWLEGIEEGQ
jgi:hypothetical protein